MNLGRVTRGILLAAMASAAVFAVLAVVTDGAAVVAAAGSVPLSSLVVMVVLTTVSFVVRAVRWGALMRTVGYPPRASDAVFLQFSSQMMSVTPGRVGELVKPWMALELAGMPMSTGVALILSERLADLIAVCVLSFGGATVIGGGWLTIGSAFLLVLGGAIVISSARFHRFAISVLSRRSRIAQHLGSAETVSRVIRATLSLRVSSWSVPCSMVAWGLEGVGFALCLQGLGFTSLSITEAVSIYAISTIAGALTFLPGGIGLTEASMTGLLVAAGMEPAAASAATLITRLVTLWWGVGVGWLTLASRPALLARITARGGA